MSQKLDQRVAIVTGGARGIGRGCALNLAEAGCAVVLVDLLEAEMSSTSKEIEALGHPACRSRPMLQITPWPKA